jgi:PAS domain S-box-containing protein
MRSVASAAYYFGYALILSTLFSALVGLVRRRDTNRLLIAAVVGTIAVIPLLRRPGAPAATQFLGNVLLWGLPYLLLRLVGQFRDVPRLVVALAIGLIVGGSVSWLVWPVPGPSQLGPVLPAWWTGVAGCAAFMFSSQVRKASGVTRRRLIAAAVGTWLYAASAGTAVAFGTVASPDVRAMTAPFGRLLVAATLFCYFIAFSTPRRLKLSWQRGEQARYLGASAERSVDERANRTAEDLNGAAARSVGNSFTAVALRPSADAPVFTIQAATGEGFVGQTIHPDAGVFARARAGGVMAAVSDCPPDIAARLTAYGTHVLVVPIGSPSRVWGLVLVVQRHGSLFPEDDLGILEQMARYAATTLDHAQLIAEARARERRASDRRLREIEARMSLMLDSIKDYALVALDEAGRVVSWHVGATHLFGYESAEMTDEPAAPLFGMPPNDFAALLDEARRLGTARREGPCRRKDGGTFLGVTDVRPLEGELDARGFVAVTHDITARRELEERLRQSQKMEAIGQLAGGIAHDFNNMLTAILGYADWLETELAPDDPRRRQVDEIQKAAERAAGLTRQLMTFSRGQMLQPSIINLSRLVKDLIPMLHRTIGEHIEVVDDCSAAVAPIVGDRTQVQQVILNLAVNARDAMPGGGRLTIRTAAVWLDSKTAGQDVLPGPFVLLEVSDTGSGMDEATQSRIFEPFFTTKALGHGTGLGLATVFGILKQMGGAVRVFSRPGEGATFRLYFPEARGREAAIEPAAVIAVHRGSETVLLVEDDVAVRQYLTQVLEQQGYRVIAAENQDAALARVQAHVEPIHLVVTDVIMPGGTGPELVRALDQVRPGLPALYISGYADVVLSRQATVPKAGHFLQKPFSASDLLGKIRQILSPTA